MPPDSHPRRLRTTKCQKPTNVKLSLYMLRMEYISKDGVDPFLFLAQAIPSFQRKEDIPSLHQSKHNIVESDREENSLVLFDRSFQNWNPDYVPPLCSKTRKDSKEDGEKWGYDEGMDSPSLEVLPMQSKCRRHSPKETENVIGCSFGDECTDNSQCVCDLKLDYRALLVLARHFGLASDLLPGLTDHTCLARIFNSIGRLQYKIGKMEEAAVAFRKALGSLRNKKTLIAAATLNSLGVVHFHAGADQSSEKALQCFSDSLALRRAILGTDCPNIDVATTLNNIGRAYYSIGEYNQASEAFNEALEIRRTALGNTNVDTGASAFCFAQSQHLLGYWDVALEYYIESHGILTQTLGGQHRDVATVLTCMARIHQDRNEYSKAIRFYKEALAVGVASLGPVHLDVANILKQLGNVLFEEKDYDGALRHYMHSLEVEHAIFNSYQCPKIAITLINIGQLYQAKGEYETAIPFVKGAVSIYQRTIGANHPGTASAMAFLGLLNYQTGTLNEALDAYLETLAIQRHNFGFNSLEIAATINSIGLVLYNLKNHHDLVLQCLLESLRIHRKLLGCDHQEVSYICHNIGTIHLESGDDTGAMAFFKESLRIERANIQSCNMETALSITLHMGYIHQRSGDLANSLEHFYEALQILKLSPHANGVAVARAWNYIGNLHMQRGETKQLMEAYCNALRILRQNASGDELEIVGGNMFNFARLNPECAAGA